MGDDFIMTSSRAMASDATLAAASKRAGSLMGLPYIEDELGGYEQLRGVNVNDWAGSTRQALESSFSRETPPPDDFISYTAAGLQAMMAEACLFGWFLFDAEA